MITVSIIGAGNVATHLFKAFSKTKTVSVKQWYSRDLTKISSFKNKVEILEPSRGGIGNKLKTAKPMFKLTI